MKWRSTISMTLFIIAFLILVGMLIYIPYDEPQITKIETKHGYLMPDGAVCYIRDGGYKVVFDSCDNNRKYINPDWYEEIEVRQ